MTKQEYINSIEEQHAVMIEPMWSEPKYDCVKCGGGMCKNNMIVLSSYPPSYEYKCNSCGNIEYLRY